MKLSWKTDLPASLVVFIVAVPLSLGIALASGTSPASGLIAAAIGGIVVGLLSGAPLMVSGPAAGLTVLVFQVVQSVGITGLAIATGIAGLIQLGMSILKTGWVFKKFPAAILNGMLAAIGLIILLGQLHVLLGQSVPSSPMSSVTGLGASITAAFASEGSINPVVWISVVAIGTLMGWPSLSSRFSALRLIPPALPAVVFATLMAIPFVVSRIEVGNIMGSIGGSLTTIFSAIGGGQIQWVAILSAAFGIAIVASAESLLTARAVTILKKERDVKIHGSATEMPIDLDRELLAQGAGNLASGVLGGLPITGVIVRTAANVESGGETRLSTILHGVWVTAFVLAIPFVLNTIPLAALAAVLVMTGVKLLNVQGLLSKLKEDRNEGLLWVVTIVAIVSTNLLVGLVIAVGFAVLMNFRGTIEWISRASKIRRARRASRRSGKVAVTKGERASART